MCMSRTLNFIVTLLPRCETCEESRNYKKKMFAHNGIRTHYLPLTRLTLYPILQMNHFHCKHLYVNYMHTPNYVSK